MQSFFTPAKLVEYDFWANREVLQSLRQPTTPPKAAEIMGHILAVSRLWLDRLCVRPQSMPTWPKLSLEELSELAGLVEKEWNEYLGDNRRLAANEEVTYVNSMGESFRNRPSEILTQTFLHGAYHRGQIAVLLRQSGGTPVLTDYIHAVRTHAVSA